MIEYRQGKLILKWFKIFLHKSYYDYGSSLTAIFRPLVFLIGGGTIIASGGDSRFAVIAYSSFVIFCYILGKWASKHGLREADTEVTNRFNLFVTEMRKRKHI